MPIAFRGLRVTLEASAASLLALRTDPLLPHPPLEAPVFHQGPCRQDLRNPCSQMCPITLAPPGPCGHCACSKGLEGRRGESRLDGGRACISEACKRGQEQTDSRKHGNRSRRRRRQCSVLGVGGGTLGCERVQGSHTNHRHEQEAGVVSETGEMSCHSPVAAAWL